MAFKGLPYYLGVFVTRCTVALRFVFRAKKDRDTVVVSSCSGWLRHMGRFHESRIYHFALDTKLTWGYAEVQLLDQKKKLLCTLNARHPNHSIFLHRQKRYYLKWTFQRVSGQCVLTW